MLEGEYKTQLTKKILKRFPGLCEVVRLDSALRQGVPDMGVLFRGGYWALLEAKTRMNSKRQPNQEHYVEVFNDMCFAAFICPQNEEAVLDELQQELETRWATCLP